MEHLEWLVQSRSGNQQATVALYRTIATHRLIISEDIELQNIAEELAAVAFSLWRAVFLSDLSKTGEGRLGHLDLFLESLIADNTVVYATDKRSREWTFRYYMSNARYRLLELADGTLGDLIDKALVDRPPTSKMDEWTLTQHALCSAIARFDNHLQQRSREP